MMAIEPLVTAVMTLVKWSAVVTGASRSTSVVMMGTARRAMAAARAVNLRPVATALSKLSLARSVMMQMTMKAMAALVAA